MPPHMESETENHPLPPQLTPYLEVEGIKDEGFSPHMHVGGMWGTLDVGIIAHSPAQVVHGQHRSLVHALWPQVLVVCGHRGGGTCRHGSPKHGHLRHNQAGIPTHTRASTAAAQPAPFPSQCLYGRPQEEPSTSLIQPVPAEMELKPKAKGGVSPSCTDTLTLDSEAHRMMGARIWG